MTLQQRPVFSAEQTKYSKQECRLYSSDCYLSSKLFSRFIRRIPTRPLIHTIRHQTAKHARHSHITPPRLAHRTAIALTFQIGSALLATIRALLLLRRARTHLRKSMPMRAMIVADDSHIPAVIVRRDPIIFLPPAFAWRWLAPTGASSSWSSTFGRLPTAAAFGEGIAAHDGDWGRGIGQRALGEFPVVIELGEGFRVGFGECIATRKCCVVVEGSIPSV